MNNNERSDASSRIVFTPSGRAGQVAIGATVLDAARELGVDLDSVCGGRGICGRCSVVPAVGAFPKWNITMETDTFGPRNDVEQTYASRRSLAEGYRLGCQLKVTSDVVVDVPSTSQVHRPVVRKKVDLTGLVVDPIITRRFVVVEPASLGDDRSAARRIADALRNQHGLSDVYFPPHVLPTLHRAVASSEGTTIAVTPIADVLTEREHDEAEPIAEVDAGWRVVGAWPGYVEQLGGVAIDIGSTTVAGHLCDLATGDILASGGRMNPQIRYGEDLMSRVSYVMMNPGGDQVLTNAIRETLNEIIDALLNDATMSADRLVDIVLVGNPIMHHLVLGIDPTPLGGAPFELATSSAVRGRARDLALHYPNADVYVGPCIAGHVGADTAAAILSEGPHRNTHVQLLVDVGTNAEIVLGTSERQYAASSPTGPAFEGAQISCGQRATVGAIERVRIDRETFEPRVKVIGSELWSDDPSFVASLGETKISGVCGSGIIEVIGELFLSGLLRSDGTFDGSLQERTTRLVDDGRTLAYVLFDDGESRLCITQNDVRAIQLAKAALRAGIELLRDHAKFDSIDDIRLAGAFGAHIDPVYALVLGLVPDSPVSIVKGTGNSAGSGAVRALLSRVERFEMEATVRGVVKIETALEPAFQQHFVDAMAFPHATAPSPHLAAAIALPAPTSSGADGPRRRRGAARSSSGRERES